MKKLFAVLLALTLVLSMGTIALAAGETGTITIEKAIPEATYSAYQMLVFTPSSDDGRSGVYTIADGWEAFFNGEIAQGYFAKTADGKVTLKEGVTAVSAELAKAAVEYAEGKTATNSVKAPKATNPNEELEVVIDNLPLGYYAVDTTAGSVCSLTRTNFQEVVIEKNSKPEITKKIVEGTKRVDANNAAIGDTITYEATITVRTGAENYVMHDKMDDGLSYTGVKSVTVDGVAVSEDNYTVSTSTGDGCTFEISFDNDYVKDLADKTNIVVTYTATLDTDANVGTTGNPNEVWLDYGDNMHTLHDFVITYTTKLTIDKVDANGPLKGAGFTLYKGEEVIGEIAAGETTKFEWTGLEAGTYTLVETTVPNGYNKANDITFTIECKEPDEVTSAADKADWSVTGNGVTETIENDVELGVFEGTVINNTGALLPETGGIGTTIFYIVGIVMMLGAAIVLISKKRMASFA